MAKGCFVKVEFERRIFRSPQPPRRNKRCVPKTQMPALSSVSDGLIFKDSVTGLKQGWQIRGPSAEGRFVRGEAIWLFSESYPFH